MFSVPYQIFNRPGWIIHSEKISKLPLRKKKKKVLLNLSFSSWDLIERDAEISYFFGTGGGLHSFFSLLLTILCTIVWKGAFCANFLYKERKGGSGGNSCIPGSHDSATVLTEDNLRLTKMLDVRRKIKSFTFFCLNLFLFQMLTLS